jgi:hypothetical protein
MHLITGRDEQAIADHGAKHRRQAVTCQRYAHRVDDERIRRPDVREAQGPCLAIRDHEGAIAQRQERRGGGGSLELPGLLGGRVAGHPAVGVHREQGRAVDGRVERVVGVTGARHAAEAKIEPHRLARGVDGDQIAVLGIVCQDARQRRHPIAGPPDDGIEPWIPDSRDEAALAGEAKDDRILTSGNGGERSGSCGALRPIGTGGQREDQRHRETRAHPDKLPTGRGGGVGLARPRAGDARQKFAPNHQVPKPRVPGRLIGMA